MEKMPIRLCQSFKRTFKLCILYNNIQNPLRTIFCTEKENIIIKGWENVPKSGRIRIKEIIDSTVNLEKIFIQPTVIQVPY